MIYTFYGRISTDEELQLTSINNQQQYWLEFFEKNGMEMNPDCGVFYKRDGTYQPTKGYYIDEGISGYKSKKYRRAYTQMLNDAKLGHFNMIYTSSISRFGRNVKEILNAIELLRKYNVGIIFEDVNINTLDQNDNFKILIFAGLAEEESRLKSASVQRGKRVAAKKGIWSGREPYGYNIADAIKYPHKRGQLVINEQEAVIVRKIFDLYVNDGWGYSRIAKYLNENSIPRKRGASKWDTSIIGKMISNPLYNGLVWQNRTYTKDPQQNIIAKVPKDQQVEYQDESLRIIDKKTYETAQAIKAERSKTFGDFKYKEKAITDDDGNVEIRKVRIGVNNRTGRYSGAHLFSNLLRCGNCGGTLRYKKQVSTSKRVHHYWFCVNNERYGNCKYRNLQRQEELTEWVKQEITKFRNKTAREYDLNRLINLKYNKNDAHEKLIQLNAELAEKKRESEFNLQAWSKKYISEAEFANRAKKLTNEIESIETEMVSLKHIDREVKKLKEEYSNFMEYLKDIDLDNLNNQILRNIIVNIKFTTRDGETERIIDWKFINQSLTGITVDSIIKYETERLGVSPKEFLEMLAKP